VRPEQRRATFIDQSEGLCRKVSLRPLSGTTGDENQEEKERGAAGRALAGGRMGARVEGVLDLPRIEAI